MCFPRFSEQDNNETECWKQRVDLFVDESLSPAVKSCIDSYAEASERNEYYSGRQYILKFLRSNKKWIYIAYSFTITKIKH